jgi:hypothetical protein
VRRLRWDSPDRDRQLPKHPYPDTVILYGVVAFVVITAATGGGMGRAIFNAAAVFVVATASSWRSWRNRLREDRARQDDGPR